MDGWRERAVEYRDTFERAGKEIAGRLCYGAFFSWLEGRGIIAAFEYPKTIVISSGAEREPQRLDREEIALFFYWLQSKGFLPDVPFSQASLVAKCGGVVKLNLSIPLDKKILEEPEAAKVLERYLKG